VPCAILSFVSFGAHVILLPYRIVYFVDRIVRLLAFDNVALTLLPFMVTMSNELLFLSTFYDKLDRHCCWCGQGFSLEPEVIQSYE